MKAISVRQPWAWLLIHAGKDIENRDWPTNYRGLIAIHAAKGMTRDEYEDAVDFVRQIKPACMVPAFTDLERGSVIGVMTLVNCVTSYRSPWFQGKYGFVMADPYAIHPVPAKGSLGLWEWNWSGTVQLLDDEEICRN